MPPIIATCVYVSVIIGLFVLDREPEAQVSKAVLLPLAWLMVSSSRSITEWLTILQTGQPPKIVDQAQMYADGSALDRNVFIVLMVLALVVLIKRGRWGALLLANLPIVLFLFYGAFSSLWSDFPDVTIRRLFRAVGCVLMVLVVLSERDRDSAMRRLFVWVGFVLIPCSILLIKYYPAIGRTFVVADISTWLVSPVGVTTHKNTLGGICQVYGIAFLWHFLTAYRDRKRPHRTRHLIAHGMALVMVAWLFVQVNSVTAQSCFLIAAVFLIATSSQTIARKPLLVHVLVFVLVLVPLILLFSGAGASTLEAMGRDPTLTGRTNIWPRVIALVDHPLVGTGFESFWLGKRLQVMQQYQRGLNETHNGYLEIWVSLGWIGVLILGVMMMKGYRAITSGYRQNPNIGKFRLAYLLTVIISGFTEAAFRTESISWMVFLLITMVTPQDALQEAAARVRARVGRRRAQLESVAVGSSLH